MGFVIDSNVLKKYTEDPGVTVVIIPDGVTEIAARAFFGCYNLISVAIPNSVTAIGEAAFSKCENLYSVIVPDSVKKIGEHAFTFMYHFQQPMPGYARYNKKGVFVNSHMTLVTPRGSYAATYAREWNISVIETTESNIGFEISLNKYIDQPGITEIAIPDCVTEIDGMAFENCQQLKRIFIPESVTKISEETFWGCEDLTIVTTPGSYANEYAKKKGIKVSYDSNI